MKKRFVTGIILCLILTINGTYCLFHERASANISIKAASNEDLIKEIRMEEVNPTNILIEKGQIEYEPLIYFEVEGDIKEYITHINAAKLNESIICIPIKVNVNLKQFVDMLFGDTDVVEGIIRAKYLDEYYNQPLNIKITKDYITNTFLQSLSLENMENSNEHLKIQEIISFLNEYLPAEGPPIEEGQESITD